MFRIGHGYDVHAFGPGQDIVLGGTIIPYSRGLVAHSDGDVLLHALCDALLGACGLGDIGAHFPDSDLRWRGADSRVLLRHCVSLCRQAGYCVANADMTIIAESPKMAPHIAAMVQAISHDLQVAGNAVNVKATTTEKLGYIGRGEGIACHAVALMQTLSNASQA